MTKIYFDANKMICIFSQAMESSEVEILSTLQHPNIVAFYGVLEDGPGSVVATVSEYMVDGSLRDALRRNNR